MHDVSNAINILDPNKDAIDKAICGSKWVKDSGSAGKETADKCWNGSTGSNKPDNYDRLSKMFNTDAENKNSYPGDATNLMGNETSKTISKDVSGLNREQKGVVSSAFAKAHEGA